MAADPTPFVMEVATELTRLEWLTELQRENPILLAGSGRTVDQLPPPPSPLNLWRRTHRAHRQYLIATGRRDRFGPIEVWGCMDCHSPEPEVTP